MLISIIVISLAVALGVGMTGSGPDLYKETFDNWDKAVSKYVGDDDREKQAKGILKSARKSITETRKESNEAMDEFFTVDRRYDATLEDYEAVITSLDEIWLKSDKQILDERAKLKAVLTDKEWKKCIKYSKKKMKKINKDARKAVKKQEKERAKQLKKIKKREKKERKKKAKDES